MSRRARALTARTAYAWLGAAAGSLAIHVGFLFALVRGHAVEVTRGPWDMAPPPPPDWIDVVSLDDPASRPPLVAVPDPDRARAEGSAADQTHEPATTTAPRIAEGRAREIPAADVGDRAGRSTDGAWRRDRSTLRARLTDGATVFQSPRSDTGVGATSPQAIRREPEVGQGDTLRTTMPAVLPSAPQLPAGAESTDGDVARPAPGLPAAGPVVVVAADLSARVDQAQPLRGVGPLQVDQGARAFDNQAPGPAADSRNQRAASNELRPGVIDLSHAGVQAPDEALTGRGPGDAPGAVDRPTQGRAPAEYGGSRAQTVGETVAERTRSRAYDLYKRELQRRVNSLGEFPKKLALRLEQGETVVRFVVDPDGRVRGGVQVSKSSGFDEFDAEATRAVERAAPFPPLPPVLAAHPLPVSVRFAFQNPLIR
jgi:TonB family protein